MRVDSHHHFWNYSAEQYPWIAPSMQILRQNYGPNELEPEITHSGIDAVISVQARQTTEETEWLLGIAEQNSFVVGVVGWLPLASPDIGEHLSQYSEGSLLKGIRHVVHDEPDDAFILGTDFNRGVGQIKTHGMVYDILIFAKHLENTIKFVDQHPEQPFVLDHIAKPTIQEAEFHDAWKQSISELAKRPNVACKFSGVATEVKDKVWTVEMIKPYWDVVWEAFGSERLMFGSDWPVCLLRTPYVTWVDAVTELAIGLSEAEREAFWGGNAERIYKL